MFSAGMGIGLMFYGVNEPLTFFADTAGYAPPGTEGLSDPQRAEAAMAHTLFHWTLHPWAIYAVVGLAIAYGVYRKGRLQLISAAFEPAARQARPRPRRQGDRHPGDLRDPVRLGRLARPRRDPDRVAASQIVARHRRGRQRRPRRHHRVLTVCFVLSAVSGVAKGIQWLSNINMVLALALAVFVFVVGPTMFILNMVPTLDRRLRP